MHLWDCAKRSRFAERKDQHMALVICSGKVNRYGFRVLPEGIRLENYRANPVLLVWHEMSGLLPVGKLNNLRVENGVLLADDPEWDEDDTFAMRVKGKYEKGMMNACSLQVDPITVSEDPALLLPGQSRPTISDSDLLEVSMVSVPGDAGAVRLSHEGVSDLEKLLPKIELAAPTKTVQSMDIKAIALSLGLKEDASETEVANAVNALKLQAEAARQSEVENLLALGRTKGVVNDANVESFKLMATNNPGEMKKMLDSIVLTVITPATPTQTLAEKMVQLTAGNGGSQADDRNNWTFDDWNKKDSKGLLAIKQNDPARYKKLALAYAGKAVMVLLLVFLSFTVGHSQVQVRWPSGKADVKTLAIDPADSTADATILNGLSYLTVVLTKNTTLHLDTPGKPRHGDMLIVDASCGSVAKSLTCGDKLQCPVISGTINKGRNLFFVFNGTKFVLVANTQYN